jgi:tetratricopeptide (TPR) repeat protein
VFSFGDFFGSLDAASQQAVRAWKASHPTATFVLPPSCDPTCAGWPFSHPLTTTIPTHVMDPSTGSAREAAAIICMPETHEAFVNHQVAGTRLVTTQAAFLFESWHALRGDRDDLLFVGRASRESLARHAPDVLAGTAPFLRACVISITDEAGATGELDTLPRAFRTDDPGERLALCVRALDEGRTAPRLLAAASTCMEVSDLEAAARDLDEALAQAPEWAAAHFERGKLWLRLDDMERASEAFAAAADRLPGFGAAWANLGATLGELDRPHEALGAFQRALQCDPESHQALNNIGVVSRELGQLAESEAAFRRVIALVPELAFGYYNLGHTLFLQGRYQAALSAYAEGRRRDPEKNAVQATRLAMCRLATGDAAGALNDLQGATASLPREYRQQLLADTSAIAWALFTHRPDLPGWGTVNDWLTREMTRQ